MIAARQIRSQILEIPEGEPFTRRRFVGLGTREAIVQTLSRLVGTGMIERLKRGVFVRPKRNPYVGTVMPSVEKIVQEIAKSRGATIQVHGAEAARRLGLSTQVPTQHVFYTSGSTTRFMLGRMKVELRHAGRAKLVLSKSPAGLAISALLYLGRKQVNRELIETIRNKLAPSEYEEFRNAMPSMPAWMANAVFRYEQERAVA